MDPKLCECGCGSAVTVGSRFIKGHNTRSPEFQRLKVEGVKRSFDARRHASDVHSHNILDGILNESQLRSVASNYVQSDIISKEELMQLARIGLMKSLNLPKISTQIETTSHATPVKRQKRAYNKYQLWSKEDLGRLAVKYNTYRKLDTSKEKRHFMKMLRKTFGRTTYAIKYQFHIFNHL